MYYVIPSLSTALCVTGLRGLLHGAGVSEECVGEMG